MVAHMQPQIMKGLPDLTLPTALQNNFNGGSWNIAMGKVCADLKRKNITRIIELLTIFFLWVIETQESLL